jgi:hypothetical protein
MNKDPLPKGAKKSYDHKADVYSFALTLWSLIKNQTPFKDRKDFMAAYATINVSNSKFLLLLSIFCLHNLLIDFN